VPTYRLDLEYDGSDFHGWQMQPGRRTVQGELAAALARLCRGPVVVVGAGRTDAGVHAIGQVASFEADRDIDPLRLLAALQGLLPPDLRVWRAGRTAPGYSARHSASSRRYEYRMLRRPSALLGRHHHVLSRPVDAETMAAAAGYLRGTHDFSAFAATDSAGPHRICTILDAAVHADDRRVCFTVEANRFLHHMVRRLAGALVEVGRGRFAPAMFGRILADRDASRGGPTLPACGLFLVAVRYPVDPEFEASAVGEAGPLDPGVAEGR
jgi:tRNA pseudouridine38-40 synthase